MFSGRLIIHAPNVHTGGGQTLLRELLAAVPGDSRGTAILDRRLAIDSPLPPGFELLRVRPTVRERLDAERRLARMADDQTRVLCFGNLPPLLRCRGRVSVFLHNRHLVDSTSLSEFGWRARLRLGAERIWVRWLASHADEWIVQTESMRLLGGSVLGSTATIRVLPFVPSAMLAGQDSGGGSQESGGWLGQPAEIADFCYVASGEPHKNHRKLIQAWVLLAAEGLFPSLRITLEQRECADLCEWIERQKRRYGLRVENLGRVLPAAVAAVYRSSRCLIHPSWCESFGLPLLEARNLGISIVAAELDYVRDLVTPAETFDPQSPRSIARAVRRFLGARAAAPELLDGRAFLEQLSAA